MRVTSLFLLFFFLISFQSFNWEEPKKKYPQLLSEWKFFKDQISNLQPADRVFPYELNSPLFSDYAWKSRFIYIPQDKKMKYQLQEVFHFPIGAVIIKNFYYPSDFRKPKGQKTLLETRLLIHEENGWEAISYIWNQDQTDALLDLAGDTKAVQFIDNSGKKQKINYIIPNKNQCKGCHSFKDQLLPIGPSARQLNKKLESGEQINYFLQKEILESAPELTSIPKMAAWEDNSSGSLHDRARAWLDVNCGHCHRPEGPANTSGLLLHYAENNPISLGVNKTPVAAGRGSGGFQFDIEPGHPEKSILVYRIESMDPGVMMPEIARTLVHKEGVQLIKEWIKQMK